MILCPNCQKELDPNAKFCSYCGTKVAVPEEAAVEPAVVYETIYCPNCGEKTTTEFAFCPQCGSPTSIQSAPEDVVIPAVQEVIPAVQEVIPVVEEVIPTLESNTALLKLPKMNIPKMNVKASPKIPKKALLFGGIAVAVILVVVLVLSLLPGNAQNYALYLKEDEIFYSDLKKDGIVEVTSRLFDDDPFSLLPNNTVGTVLGQLVAFTEDGTGLFYPDRTDTDAEGFTLYFRDITKPKHDPIKIDSDIISYAISPAGDHIIYIKGEDGLLYISDLEEKEKIASDVEAFTVSEDCKKVVFYTFDEDLYTWSVGQDRVKVASEVQNLRYCGKDLSTLYFVKDDSLYKYTVENEEKEKVVSDYAQILAIYDSGEIYYTEEAETSVSLKDYVEDDLAAADAALKEPEDLKLPDAPEYPFSWKYDSDDDYKKARTEYTAAKKEYDETCAALREEYNNAWDKYNEKLRRDTLRKELEEQTLDKVTYSLYYFDGAETTLVTDNMVSKSSLAAAKEAAALVVDTYLPSDAAKVKLSKVSSFYEISDMVQKALYEEKDKNLVVKFGISSIEQSEASDFRLAKDGAAAYFLDDISNKGEGDLYKITIKDGVPGDPELFDSDVSDYIFALLEDTTPIYFKNFDDEDDKGDLYLNGVEVDYDVSLYNNKNLENGALLYFTDWNTERHSGTLKMYHKEEAVKLSDDVHSFAVTKDLEVLYLYDYSIDDHEGTLYLHRSKEPVKIDEEVAALIPVNDNQIRGVASYAW